MLLFLLWCYKKFILYIQNFDLFNNLRNDYIYCWINISLRPVTLPDQRIKCRQLKWLLETRKINMQHNKHFECILPCNCLGTCSCIQMSFKYTRIVWCFMIDGCLTLKFNIFRLKIIPLSGNNWWILYL